MGIVDFIKANEYVVENEILDGVGDAGHGAADGRMS